MSVCTVSMILYSPNVYLITRRLMRCAWTSWSGPWHKTRSISVLNFISIMQAKLGMMVAMEHPDGWNNLNVSYYDPQACISWSCSFGPRKLASHVENVFGHAVMSPDHADCPLTLYLYKPYFIYSYSAYISPF